MVGWVEGCVGERRNKETNRIQLVRTNLGYTKGEVI